MKCFKQYHPITCLIYFVFVIVTSVIIMNPIFLAISLFSSVCFAGVLKGQKAFKFNFAYALPIVVISSVVNPLFSHAGVTVLGYFKSGNPLTLESVYYGIASGVMLASVMNWFLCFNEIMTSDKIMYLFGKAFPSLSLVFSMTLGFIPKFRKQLKAVYNAQKGMLEEGMLNKIKNGLSALSAVITWALENGVETAESMKNRGFAAGRRTAFSIFEITARDISAITIILICGIYVLSMSITGTTHFSYYPKISQIVFSFKTVSVYIAYVLLSLYPVFIEAKEEFKWFLQKI